MATSDPSCSSRGGWIRRSGRWSTASRPCRAAGCRLSRGRRGLCSRTGRRRWRSRSYGGWAGGLGGGVRSDHGAPDLSTRRCHSNRGRGRLSCRRVSHLTTCISGRSCRLRRAGRLGRGTGTLNLYLGLTSSDSTGYCLRRCGRRTRLRRRSGSHVRSHRTGSGPQGGLDATIRPRANRLSNRRSRFRARLPGCAVGAGWGWSGFRCVGPWLGRRPGHGRICRRLPGSRGCRRLEAIGLTVICDRRRSCYLSHSAGCDRRAAILSPGRQRIGHVGLVDRDLTRLAACDASGVLLRRDRRFVGNRAATDVHIGICSPDWASGGFDQRRLLLLGPRHLGRRDFGRGGRQIWPRRGTRPAVRNGCGSLGNGRTFLRTQLVAA